jgi:hypothetical protein
VTRKNLHAEIAEEGTVSLEDAKRRLKKLWEEKE